MYSEKVVFSQKFLNNQIVSEPMVFYGEIQMLQLNLSSTNDLEYCTQ